MESKRLSIDMNPTIHSSSLPHTNADASLTFGRDALGFEVRKDEGMRLSTVGPVDQPDTCMVLTPPAATPGLTDDERRPVAEIMEKGQRRDVHPCHRRPRRHLCEAQATGAEVAQEPTDQSCGVRCAFRDSASNHVCDNDVRWKTSDHWNPPFAQHVRPRAAYR